MNWPNEIALILDSEEYKVCLLVDLRLITIHQLSFSAGAALQAE